jgi:hypothetical protein
VTVDDYLHLRPALAPTLATLTRRQRGHGHLPGSSERLIADALACRPCRGQHRASGPRRRRGRRSVSRCRPRTPGGGCAAVHRSSTRPLRAPGRSASAPGSSTPARGSAMRSSRARPTGSSASSVDTWRRSVRPPRPTSEPGRGCRSAASGRRSTGSTAWASFGASRTSAGGSCSTSSTPRCPRPTRRPRPACCRCGTACCLRTRSGHG